jgi:hypothetical protein
MQAVTNDCSSERGAHEIAIARALLSLVEDSIRAAADLAEQLAEHLRRLGGGNG